MRFASVIRRRNCLVAILQERILDGDLGQRIRRCGFSTCTPSRRTRAMGCACGCSMASSTGSSRFSETTTSTFASGSAPCSFQAIPAAWARDFVRPRLRIDAIRLDVLFHPDVADRVRDRDKRPSGAGARRNPDRRRRSRRRSPAPCEWPPRTDRRARSECRWRDLPLVVLDRRSPTSRAAGRRPAG